MILVDEKRDVVVSGDFRKTEFKINVSSKAFQVLSSGIYTHKVRAVVREISTNAADAHLDANIEQPFSVHLPTNYEPWFSVRDYGYGLTEEQIFHLYSTYFASNRNNSNKFTGGLGLGSKSPLCITNSFTITSFQNGILKSYNVYKDEDGCPNLAILTESNTNEPNGLLVLVPVPNNYSSINEFQTEAVNVYQYFDFVPKINNPQVIAKIDAAKTRYTVVGDQYVIGAKYGKMKAVMGNVAYSIPDDLIFNFDGYIKFDIGELNFDPGRENLSLDKRTKQNLINKIDLVKEQIEADLLKLVEKEPTHFKKRMALDKLSHIVELCHTSKLQLKIPDSGITTISSYKNRFQKNVVYSFNFNHTDGRIFLYRERCENRIKGWMRQNFVKSVYILTQEEIDFIGIDPEFITDPNQLTLATSPRSISYKRVKSLKLFGQKFADHAVDINQPYIYVETFIRKPKEYTPSFLSAVADKFSIDIIGMTPATKNRGKGIELTDYLKANLKQPPVVYETPTFRENEMLSRIDKRFKVTSVPEHTKTMFKVAGVELKIDDRLIKLRDRYFKKYPMLNLVVNQHLDNSEIKIIKEYAYELH